MCGGSSQIDKPKTDTTDKTYTAPDLRQVYATWQQTGQVPYSYYGAGAPTRDGELGRVMAAYPGAFSAPPATTTPPAQSQHPGSAFSQLLSSLFSDGTNFFDRFKRPAGQ